MEIIVTMDLPSATEEEIAEFLPITQADFENRTIIRFREWRAEKYLSQATVEVPTEKFVDPVVEETQPDVQLNEEISNPDQGEV